jgi:hypothetical protein
LLCCLSRCAGDDAAQASKQAQTITAAKAGASLAEMRAQLQPASPSAKKQDAEAAAQTKVFSPQQQQQQTQALAAPPPVVVSQVAQAAEPSKGGENISPNITHDSVGDTEKKVQIVQQQQQQQPEDNITLRRSSRTKRVVPGLSTDSGGSGGSESDSHTPRTSDAGIGKIDSLSIEHVQGHAGGANAVAWMSARDFISVGSDGIAR